MPAATAKKLKDAPREKLSREQLRQLSEVERQTYYTDQLEDDFKYPLFSGKQAVLSQRRSGYRTSAKAAREIIDNGIEAGAKNIWVIFDRPGEKNREKHQREKRVSAVAFIDDGPGMTPKMARYALTWGGGTHHEDPAKIGRFGFGLPNSSINQTRRVEVYTRTDPAENWIKVVLDINELPDNGLVTVDPHEDADLPEFVESYLTRKKIGLETGTVVVWVKPDRLTYTQVSSLKEHFLDDFGVTYRYMLPRQQTKEGSKSVKHLSTGNFNLFVEDATVEPVDPMFLTPGCRYFLPPNEEEPKNGGAFCTYERHVPVKYFIDEDTGAKRLERLLDDDAVRQARDDETVLAVGTISVCIARFPYGFVRGNKKYKEEDAGKRFQVRLTRRGMCFVRGTREIETFDAYPRTKRDIASGLGKWPHVSGYAYHYGVEVRFDPDLDEAFNVGNDKQTIRPIDDFWRVMTDTTDPKVALDLAIHEEEAYQNRTRKAERKARLDPQITGEAVTAPAVEAATLASAATGKSGPLPENRREESKNLQREAAQAIVEKTGESIEKAMKAVEEEARRKKFDVEFFEARGGVFYEPGLGNGLQRIARINKLHPFYEVFYSRVAALDDPIARHAIIVLLLALADAELSAEDEVLKAMYETQRESVWSPFLKAGLKKLEEMGPEDDEIEEIEEEVD